MKHYGIVVVKNWGILVVNGCRWLPAAAALEHTLSRTQRPSTPASAVLSTVKTAALTIEEMKHKLKIIPLETNLENSVVIHDFTRFSLFVTLTLSRERVRVREYY